MDGFSSVKRPLTRDTSLLLVQFQWRPWLLFVLFAAVHGAIWTILPFALYPNLPIDPIDLIEALAYGREWQLGYDKLPPLPWWFVETIHIAFNSDFAYYCLGKFSVLGAFAAVVAPWATGQTPAGRTLSAVVIGGLLPFFYFFSCNLDYIYSLISPLHFYFYTSTIFLYFSYDPVDARG